MKLSLQYLEKIVTHAGRLNRCTQSTQRMRKQPDLIGQLRAHSTIERTYCILRAYGRYSSGTTAVGGRQICSRFEQEFRVRDPVIMNSAPVVSFLLTLNNV
jgi:hypothetical protein